MPTTSRSRSRTPRWALILAVLGIVGAIIACGGAAQGNGTTTTGGSGSSQATATTAKPKGPAHIGDTITIDGVSVTPTKVDQLQLGQYDTPPKAGDVFIAVHVKIVNRSGSEQPYNEFDFHVRSSSGNITDATFTSAYTANNELNSGNLTNGGNVEGDVVLEAPQGDHGATLTWQPSFFGNAGDNQWLLGL